MTAFLVLLGLQIFLQVVGPLIIIWAGVIPALIIFNLTRKK